MSTQVNLLPPETRERQAARRQTTLVALLGVVAIAIVILLYVLQSVTQSDLEDQVQQQQQANGALQAKASRLQKFEDLRTQLQGRQSLVDQASAGEISWSSILRDLSRVIPSRMWLTDMTGTLTGASATAAPAPAPSPGASPAPVAGGVVNPSLAGTMSFQGSALDTDTLSLWLTRLEQVPGWVNAWLSKAQRASAGNTQIFSFSSTVDLSQDLLHRGGTS